MADDNVFSCAAITLAAMRSTRRACVRDCVDGMGLQTGASSARRKSLVRDRPADDADDADDESETTAPPPCPGETEGRTRLIRAARDGDALRGLLH